MRLFPNLKIAQKLPLALIGSALLVSAGVGTASYLIGSSIVAEMSRRQIETVAAQRADSLEQYFAGVAGRLTDLARSEAAQTAVRDMALAWTQFAADPRTELRTAYIEENPNEGFARMELDVPTSAKRSYYDFTHAKVHPELRQQLRTAGLTDLYIIDADGNLVYSVAKQADFGGNVAAGGDGAATGLGAVFQEAAGLTTRGELAFADFSAYAPWGGAPASFMATPVFNNRDKFVGVLAAAVATDALNALLAADGQLGETGESFFVGSDFLMRSDSPFSEARDELTTPFRNAMVEAALAGEPGFGTSSAYRGMDMIVSAEPVAFNGTNWAVVTAIGTEEAYAPVTDMRNLMLVVGGALLALAAIVAFLFARSITRPISRLTGTMQALAAGQHETAVEGAARSDEIGAMAQAVQVFKENSVKVEAMTEEERTASEQRRLDRASMMQSLRQSFGDVVDAAVAGDFSHRVDTNFADAELNALATSVNALVATVDRGLGETGTVLAALAETDLTLRVHGEYDGAFRRLKDDTNAVADRLTEIVGHLRGTSRALKTATGEILSGANDLSERTTRQAATIEETSAAMEQLASTVQQNSGRASDAASNAADVTRAAEEGGAVMHQATEAMDRITTSSGKISNIIGLIDDIAFQTNLLALNASVEAARAGEAGKGFAVVAVEVRRLAQSAAEASSEVKALIEQSGSEVAGGSKLVAEAATKLEAMLAGALRNDELLVGIARESSEQAAAIEEVNAAVRTMDEMTQHNAALVEETNAAIEQTEAQASELDRIVERFRVVPQADAALEPAAHAAGSYRSHGNAAIDEDWSEF